jgi:hypothetical protein
MWKAIVDWFRRASERPWTNADLQSEVQQLRMEWTDVLDKLNAREDRERKRLARLLRGSLEPDPMAGSGEPAPLSREAQKAQLRSRMLK